MIGSQQELHAHGAPFITIYGSHQELQEATPPTSQPPARRRGVHVKSARFTKATHKGLQSESGSIGGS